MRDDETDTSTSQSGQSARSLAFPEGYSASDSQRLALQPPAVIFAAHVNALWLGCSSALRCLLQARHELTVVFAGADSLPGLSVGEDPAATVAQTLNHRWECDTAPASAIYWSDLAERDVYSSATIARISALLQESGFRTVLAPPPADSRLQSSLLGMAVREAVRRSDAHSELIWYSSTGFCGSANDAAVEQKISVDIPIARPRRPRRPREPNTSGETHAPRLLLAERYVVARQRDFIEPMRGLSRTRSGSGLSRDANAPLVSVITRTIQRPELDATLDSIAGQTYGNIEVLLVDASGGASLASRDQCGRFPLRGISGGKALSRSVAANAGLDSARGKYVLFLDDDDWIHPDHVESLVSAISASSGKRAAYSETACVAQADGDEWRISSYYDSDYDPGLLLVENFLPVHAVLFERGLVGQRLRFDERLNVYEEWDFWLQLTRLTSLAQTNHLTALYRVSLLNGSAQREADPAAAAGYKAVIAKWHESWSADQLEQVARDAAAQRRGRLRRTRPDADCREGRMLPLHSESDRILRRRVQDQSAQIGQLETTIAVQGDKVHRLLGDVRDSRRQAEERKLQAEEQARSRARTMETLGLLARRLDALQTGPSWQLTTPFRALEQKVPSVLRPVVAALRVCWWSLTWQLPSRLRIRRQANQILRHGLFDRDWYTARYPDVVLRGLNPLLHWIAGGWKEGRWPNNLFDTGWYVAQHRDIKSGATNPLEHFLTRCGEHPCDPNPLFHSSWYLRQYPDVARLGINPLVHFLDVGGKEERDPNPLFDTRWYLTQNPEVAASGMNPLAHYLHFGAQEGRDPNPYFDTDRYLAQNPGAAEKGVNPLAHYLQIGAAEGRAPSAAFDPARYLKRHPEAREAKLSPLVHFLENRRERVRQSAPPTGDGRANSEPFVTLYDEMLRTARRQPEADCYVAESPNATAAPETPIRVIAFYLPQFHPIPENDAWWGKGFTEWTNVSKAVPQFEGHYQPRLPGALGFYDLRLQQTQKEQIALARKYGVYGFCYHHYWFAGRRLLERPLRQMLDDPSMDFPFCICWANENWTRRWDGCDEEILLGQHHSREDDLRFISELEPALRDPRYISINGRPLLIVYRPQLFPDPEATARLWRDYLRRRGLPDPYLVNVWSFPDPVDPRSIGFDASLEFPPHQFPCDEIGGKLPFLNPAFDGRVCDYNACVDHAENMRYQSRDFDLFPGVMTAWDNTPRRLEHGTVYANASPGAYKRWMLAAGERALDFEQPDKRLVFINAWNEWAEGTYLEPDRRYGYAYLQATKDALETLRVTVASARRGGQQTAGDAGGLGPHLSGTLRETDR